MTREEMLVLKMNLLGGIYAYLGQDEDAYAMWIQWYSDEPDEDDLKEIAEDETEWRNACARFGEIVNTYHLENPMD